MLLKEFFSRPIEIDQNHRDRDQQGQKIDDELFWYILDHDKLHKEYFFPIAKKLKTIKECGDSMIYELFMPMVIKGCKEFYSDRKMEGRLSKKFPLELREGICKKLYEHYLDDVKKDKYKLG